MATELSPGEARLFARYDGKDFLEDEQFWADVLTFMRGCDIPLPYRYNPYTVRLVHELLDCRAGACGDCCRYKETPIDQTDMERWDRAGIPRPPLCRKEDGTFYLDTSQGCPFLKDKRCSIYAHRPNACWVFPAQHFPDNELLFIRVHCLAAVAVLRRIVTRAARENGFKVLPNLICLSV